MNLKTKKDYVDGHDITTCEYHGETYYLYEVQIVLPSAQRTVTALLFKKNKPSERREYKPAVLPGEYEVADAGKIPEVVKR